MNLSSELISQFVKITKDDKKVDNGSTMYGTIVEYDGQRCVKLDGSDQITPITTTADVLPGDRVSVLIKNHTATVTGNATSPSARKESVDGLGKDVKEMGSKITEFELVVADMVTVEQLNATQANIELVLAEKIGTAELEAQKAEIDTLLAKKADIEELNAAKADIDELTANMLTVDVADAKYATIAKLDATNATVNKLDAAFADLEEATVNKLAVQDGYIEDLRSDVAEIDTLYAKTADVEELYAKKADVELLEADVADIDTLIFGSASGTTIQTSFANAVIAQLGNAQIKSAMIDHISADKINAGDINTNNVRVVSEDGRLVISDETIQISDATRVRVQIGKDAAGDYSISIWDADGNLMFSEGGITDSAIKDAIIRNDMVANDANIAASKLDISSLFTEINNSTETINAGRVTIDTEGQTIDVAFTSMSSELDSLGETVSSQGTQLSVIQGQISSKIWQQDIEAATDELGNEVDNLSTKQSSLEQTIDSVSATVSQHTTQIANKADSSAVTEISDKVTELEADIDGFRSTVSETYATKTQLASTDAKVNEATEAAVAAQNTANTAKANAETAQKKANDAATAAANAQQAADDADAKAAQAAADLATAQQNLASVTSRVDATEDEVAAAQEAVKTAQTAADKAKSDAAAAQSTADTAKANAATAQTAANNAKTAADNAQAAADNAQKAADDAQKAADDAQADVDALAIRVTTAETKITQNSEQIALMAKKSEVAEMLDGYSTKEETEAAISVKANEITSTVSETYATKEEAYIMPVISGQYSNDVAIANALQDSIENIRIYGKTTRFTSTGAQLLNLSGVNSNGNGLTAVFDDETGILTINGTTSGNGNLSIATNLDIPMISGESYILSYTKIGGTITIPEDSTSSLKFMLWSIFSSDNSTYADNRLRQTTDIAVGSTISQVFNGFESPTGNYTFYLQTYWDGGVVFTNYQIKVMLNKGTTVLPWEPYTGGIISPNPNYPQELESIGDDGAVDLTVKGKNLFYRNYEKTETANGVTFYWDSIKQEFVLNGTVTSNSDLKLVNPFEIDWVIGEPYTVSIRHVSGSATLKDAVSGSNNFAWSIFSTDLKKNMRGSLGYASFPDVYSFKGNAIQASGGGYLFYFQCWRTGTVFDNYRVKVQIEAGNNVTEWESYKEPQKLSVSTPNGLPGIPVSSVGNYTDENGQQWVCDEIDFARGVYIKRVKKVTVPSWELYPGFAVGDSEIFSASIMAPDANPTGMTSAISNAFEYKDTSSRNLTGFYIVDKVIFARIQGVTNEETFNSIAQNIEIVYKLGIPVETTLTEEELAQFAAISNHAGTALINSEAAIFVELSELAANASVDKLRNNLETKIDEGDSDVLETTKERITTAVQTSKEYTITALESYTTTESFNQLTDDVNKRTTEIESQLSVLSDSINMEFTSVRQDLQALTEISKRIKFDDNGITISSGDSSTTLQLDNEEGVVIKQNGTVQSRLVNNEFKTGNILVEVDEYAQFGGLRATPLEDQNGTKKSLMWVKVGG